MQSKEKTKLEDFSLPQLNILLKHLRLGQDHLNIILSPKQFQELFDWCALEEDQQKKMSADKLEKLGNMSLIINTILTSTFGAWMGLSGCLGSGLGSYTMLTFISILAFFVSGLMGYVSLQTTKNQARNAILNQMLYRFQLRVLKMINKKMEEKLHSVTFYLHTAVVVLENPMEDSNDHKNNFSLFKNNAEANQWYEKLINVLNFRLEGVNDPASAQIYQNQIQQISYLIKKTMAKYFNILESLVLSKQNEKRRSQIMPTLPFHKILTTPSFGFLKFKNSSQPWIKSHFNQLLVGIIPTIWGGFASMFVFVGGIPSIARELNFLWLASVLTSPFARFIEITLAGFITFYFAFSFLYSSRKSWQRERLQEEIDKDIASEEAHLQENTHKLDMLYKVKMHVQKLISIFTVVKKIDQSLDTTVQTRDL